MKDASLELFSATFLGFHTQVFGAEIIQVSRIVRKQTGEHPGMIMVALLRFVARAGALEDYLCQNIN